MSARSNTPAKGKLVWYKSPEYLTSSTASSWDAEDGLHKLAGHALLFFLMARLGTIHRVRREAKLSMETLHG